MSQSRGHPGSDYEHLPPEAKAMATMLDSQSIRLLCMQLVQGSRDAIRAHAEKIAAEGRIGVPTGFEPDFSCRFFGGIKRDQLGSFEEKPIIPASIPLFLTFR